MPPPGISAPFFGTVSRFPDRDGSALLTEIGELHLQLKEMRATVQRAAVLRAWIHAQPVIFTQAICCEGKDLERRIHEADALEEIARAKK